MPGNAEDLEMIHLYSREIVKTPSKRQYYNLRASIYKRLGEFEKAISDFSKTIKLKNQVKHIDYYNRGTVYHEMNDWKNALKDYNRSLRLRPGYVNALSNRSVVHSKLGNMKKAFEDISKAILHCFSDPVNYSIRARYYCDCKDYQRAVVDSTFSIKFSYFKDPKDFNNRAFAYCKLGEYEKALEDCKNAIQLDPKSNSHAHLGNVYRRQKKTGLALAQFEKAIKILPRYSMTYFYRGQLYFELGRYEDALGEFNYALELDNTFREAKVAKKLTQHQLDFGNRVRYLQDVGHQGHGSVTVNVKGKGQIYFFKSLS